MRAGGNCAVVQQTLTSEAASVLKHSLSLARRRGHAQVTPLHVAATLLSSRFSLLKRACIKSHESQANHYSSSSSNSSYPIQCRALELCFNVALNRLPTTPASLLHGQPSLSNALIAALKRAQANQRRGCIEQQQQQQNQHQHQQQNQHVLAVKVELEQLIVSILDDPSVSRVMREAGFSSIDVKCSLDVCLNSSVFQCYTASGGAAGGIYSTPNSPPTGSSARAEASRSFWNSISSSEQNPLIFTPHKKLPASFIPQGGGAFINNSGGGIYSTPSSPPSGSAPVEASRSFWNSISSYEQNPSIFSAQKKPSTSLIPQGGAGASCAAVVQVLLSKKKRNAFIIGDSISITESLIAELKSKIERGDIPEELKSAHFIRFEFCSSSPLKFMNREEVEVNISGLKSKVDNLIAGGIRGVIIYTGDLKWAVEEDEDLCVISNNKNNSPVDDLVEGIGKLVSCYENKKVWLMASANYQTYMKCQMMKPNLDIQWGLQAVHVPSNGLGLSLCAARYETMNNKNPEKEQDMLTCCAQCSLNYEKELSLKDFFKPSNDLPYSFRPSENTSSKKDGSMDLKRKWIQICQANHHLTYHGKKSTTPWWSAYSRIPEAQSISSACSSFKPTHNPNSHSVPRFRRQQSCHIEFNFSSTTTTPQEIPNLDSLKGCEDKEDNITLALGNNSLISGSGITSSTVNAGADLCKMLQESVPWQSESKIASIVQVLMESRSLKKDTWLVIKGNDNVGKKRLALAIAENVLGSSDLLLDIRNIEMLENALKHHERFVLFVEDVHLADQEFLKFLADACRRSHFDEKTCQTIFVLTTCFDDNEMRLTDHEAARTDSGSRSLSSDNKRKSEWDYCIDDVKNPRKDGMEYVHNDKVCTRKLSSNNVLDLNVKVDEYENEDKQDEINVTDQQNHLLGFLDMIKNHFVFNRDLEKDSQM